MLKKLLLSLFALLSLACAQAQVDSVHVKAPKRVAFAWGADLGAGIDMGGHDMSAININAYFGFKHKFFPLVGVGAGIDMMMSNNSRTYPVYAVVRTNFGSTRARVFGELRGGVAFNNVAKNVNQSSAYISPGIGFNFATGKSYRSYMILSWVYNDLHYDGRGTDYGLIRGLNHATVLLGVTF